MFFHRFAVSIVRILALEVVRKRFNLCVVAVEAEASFGGTIPICLCSLSFLLDCTRFESRF